MPGLLRLMDHARAWNIGMCVVTNAPRLNAEHMLTAMGLGDRFEHVLVAEELERPAGSAALPGRAAAPGGGGWPGAGVRGFVAGGNGCEWGRDLYRRDCHDADAGAAAGCGARLVVKDFDDPALWALIESMRG